MKKFTEWLSILATLKFKLPILGGQNSIQLDPLFDALKLAKSGDAYAAWVLSIFYYMGYGGIEVNSKKESEWKSRKKKRTIF